MGELVDALEDRLIGTRQVRGVGLSLIEPDGDGWALRLEDGTVHRARTVILATPALVTADVVLAFAPELARALQALQFVSTATVTVAYPAGAIRGRLEGYGYLRPRAEGGPLVACTWVSSKWPDRAPPGYVLLRAFVGRAGRDQVVGLPDADLVALVRAELADVLGIRMAPHLTRVHRWVRGMPQYTLGHRDRLDRIARQLALHRGLAVAGHSYDGVGISDCIRSGERAATTVLDQLARR
jgi:oxygen-dependent protoporphyrinogen oxidase